MDNTSFQPGGQEQQSQGPVPQVPVQPQVEAPVTPPPMEPMPQKTFKPKFIGVIVLLLVLGAGAYSAMWYWQNQQVAQEVAPTFTPRPDEIASWQTYHNDQYGFEFKYPSDAKIQEENFISSPVVYENKCRDTFKSCVRVSLTLSNGQTVKYNLQSGDEFGKDLSGSIKKEKITIDNKEYEMWVDEHNYIKVIAQNFSIWLYNDIGLSEVNLFKQILSTFKFIP